VAVLLGIVRATQTRIRPEIRRKELALMGIVKISCLLRRHLSRRRMSELERGFALG
jgi:hypothetical protein